MKKSNPMRKLYDSKLFWIIISLLLAVVMWTYVASQDTDEIKRTFRGVRVEMVGEDILNNSRNLVVTDLDTNSVTVEVVGPRRIVGALSETDLVAQIDVSKLSQAAYTSQPYTLIFPDGTDKSSLETTLKRPETVNFMVSSLTSKTVQVRGSFEGNLAPDCIAETPVFEPGTITISGAEAHLVDIESAQVLFGEGMTDVDQTYSVETGYTLVDKNGQECATAGLSFSTDIVVATLPINAVKTVPLDVNLIEGAGANSTNTKVTVEPDSVMLSGDSAILEGLNRIVLDTIDLSDFAVSYTDTYVIPLDNELTNLSGITEAKVTVEIVGLETRNFTVSNLSVTNVTEGYTAEIISENIIVTLRGTEAQLSQVKSENIRAIADLQDFNNSTGQYMAKVKIRVDGFSDVGAIGENTISLEIRKVSS